MAKLTDLAVAIHEATGYDGKLLEQATFVAAAVFADAMGHKSIGDYFSNRAASCGEQAPRQGGTYDVNYAASHPTEPVHPSRVAAY